MIKITDTPSCTAQDTVIDPMTFYTARESDPHSSMEGAEPESIGRCRGSRVVHPDFELVGVVGRGTFGEAMLVKAAGTERQYVIKQVPLLGKTYAQAEAFFAEADALQLLNHPNVVRCFRCWVSAKRRQTDGEQEGDEELLSVSLRSEALLWPDAVHPGAYAIPSSLNLLLEFINGGSLDRLIASRTERLDEFVVRIWLAQLVLGVRHMHENRLVHRDIKPANILITRNGVIKIGDLGGSQAVPDLEHECTSEYGSPLYLCPEVWSRQVCSAKSDVWSLGCVAYELLQLAPPFESPNLSVKVMHLPPIPLPLCYSTQLRALIFSMLEKEPVRRPSSAQLLQEDYLAKGVMEWITIAQAPRLHDDQVGRPDPVGRGNVKHRLLDQGREYMGVCNGDWQECN